MTIQQCLDEPSDQFPVGMRVLAVDDDPICLKILETLLRKCQYQVTTTSQAITALNMLRENKNKFDLVISDVHMPDMDGFKLLEHVGLEMDLPVIMLSANGDTRQVMKGITHGACDYLLKPIRIEELQNIWIHVVRRKKIDSKDQNNSDKPNREGDSDQNGKLNRKRKDQNEDEDEDEDRGDNGHNTDDPSTQKKPRVVWTVELHGKFVAAVNQLGIEKAVPKRILEMMNVEKLTRENVASHLQKYRLYLRKASSMASHHANMVAALGGLDSSYLQMGSLNGFGSNRSISGSAQFQNAAVRSISSSRMLGRLNTPAGIGMHSLPSLGMVQLGHAENSSNLINNQSKFHQVILPGNQNGIVLQGMPTSFEFDQLQYNRGANHIGIGDPSNATNDVTVFPVGSGVSDGRTNGSNPTNSFLGVPSNPIMLQGQPQDMERNEVSGNQSCVTVASSNAKFSSHVPDIARCIDGLPANQSSEMHLNSSILSDSFKQDIPAYFRNYKSSIAMDAGRKSHNISCITSVGASFPVLTTDPQFQEAPSVSSNSKQHMNCIPRQGRNESKYDPSHCPNLMRSSMNSVIPPHGVLGPFSQTVDSKNTVCGNNGFNSTGQPNLVDPLTMQHNEVEQAAIGTTVKLKEGYLLDQRKPQDGDSVDDVGSLEDLVSAMMRQEDEKFNLWDREFGYEKWTSATNSQAEQDQQ